MLTITLLQMTISRLKMSAYFFILLLNFFLIFIFHLTVRILKAKPADNKPNFFFFFFLQKIGFDISCQLSPRKTIVFLGDNTKYQTTNNKVMIFFFIFFFPEN